MRALRVAVAALLLAGPALAGDPGPDHASTCGGWAPQVSACTTGTHTTPALGVNTVMFGDCSALLTCFVGDVQLVLRPASGAGTTFIRTCSEVVLFRAANLWLEDCRDVGGFPPPPYVHECFARAYGTADPAAPGSGAPGASGPWTCRVVHEPIHE